jgi:ectoine hydroxylase-related dioxygenase (phytanoyl-CoA dioxygenase family)
MELIPGTHKPNTDNWITAYNKKRIVQLSRGDVLVFNSKLHHHGINYHAAENRRLLQVFDVFPDTETYNNNVHKFKIGLSSGDGRSAKYEVPIAWK